MKARVYILLFLAFCAPAVSATPDSASLYEIVIMGRQPSALNVNSTVIDSAALAALPLSSIADALECVPGVDMRARGAAGVQADVTMRGGTFEQTLVLLDGAKTIDPQTGHHLLNLPLSLDDVLRIEVVRSPGSWRYGPNALCGVVNIIPKREAGKSFRAAWTQGEYGLMAQAASLSYPVKAMHNRVSYERQASTGYTQNTAFTGSTVSYASSVASPCGDIGLFAGFKNNDFGAYKFYSAGLPNEHETVNTSFLNAAWRTQFEKGTCKAGLFRRNNRDEFIPDYRFPDSGKGVHTSATTGAQFDMTYTTPFATVLFFCEAADEELESNQLGTPERRWTGASVGVQRSFFKKLDLSAGTYFSYFPGWHGRRWPGIAAVFRANEQWRVYASAGKSFRLPTFLDLYYNTPYNVGNPQLKVESAWTFEGGVTWEQAASSAYVSVFRRQGKNLIDWERPQGTITWYACNIEGNANTTGAEAGYTRLLPVQKRLMHDARASVSYAYVTVDRALAGQESKYALDYLEHAAGLRAAGKTIANIEQSLQLRYERRVGKAGVLLLGAKTQYPLNRFRLFLEAENILDQQYTETGSIPMPGRWVRAGIAINLKLK